MASSPPSPLSTTMTTLSPYVSFYEPPSYSSVSPTTSVASLASSESSTTANAPRQPKLILFASWMDARDIHIAKYITHYQKTLYPDAIILLVKFNATLIWKGSAYQRRVIEPAVTYLRAKFAEGYLSSSLHSKRDPPEILVHIFSNGGCTSLTNLASVWKEEEGKSLPPHTAIYDSCPGLYDFWKSYNAFIVSFPNTWWRKIFVSPLLVGSLVALSFWMRAVGIWRRALGGPEAAEDLLTKNFRLLNDSELLRQPFRAYIYSKGDEMVEWTHVEKHANEAAMDKDRKVEMERLEDSKHVAHMRADPVRYWQLVAGIWSGSV